MDYRLGYLIFVDAGSNMKALYLDSGMQATRTHHRETPFCC